MVDSVAEKSGRANLFAAVTRSLKADTITICDSLNYIKGFRYQMYCAAREAHARVCTVRHLLPDLLYEAEQELSLKDPYRDSSGQMSGMAREARRVLVQACDVCRVARLRVYP